MLQVAEEKSDLCYRRQRLHELNVSQDLVSTRYTW